MALRNINPPAKSMPQYRVLITKPGEFEVVIREFGVVIREFEVVIRLPTQLSMTPSPELTSRLREALAA